MAAPIVFLAGGAGVPIPRSDRAPTWEDRHAPWTETCSSVGVHTHLDREVDFARYRTSDWIEQTVADVDRDVAAPLDAAANPVCSTSASVAP